MCIAVIDGAGLSAASTATSATTDTQQVLPLPAYYFASVCSCVDSCMIHRKCEVMSSFLKDAATANFLSVSS